MSNDDAFNVLRLLVGQYRENLAFCPNETDSVAFWDVIRVDASGECGNYDRLVIGSGQTPMAAALSAFKFLQMEKRK